MNEPPSEAKIQSVQVLQFIARGDRMAVMLYIRFPLSLRNVEDLLFEHGVDICHEAVRSCQGKFRGLRLAPIFPLQAASADAEFHSAMAAVRRCQLNRKGLSG